MKNWTIVMLASLVLASVPALARTTAQPVHTDAHKIYDFTGVVEKLDASDGSVVISGKTYAFSASTVPLLLPNGQKFLGTLKEKMRVGFNVDPRGANRVPAISGVWVIEDRPSK